ncbi:nitroreductase family protein [Mitsuokella sp.]|uniref:nitroreductase family protein n=1 Tax=Mitsuokella sp. TaxID=2049034 RepID=UPI003D7EE316
MGIQESLAKRRTYYNINKDLPVDEAKVIELVENTTELVPDAFNMKSARVIVVTQAKQDELWDAIYDAFGGKVAREKIDSFKAGYGTLLYFYDEDVVKALQEKFPLYAPNFPIWAQQANGMLQISIWTALRELNVGANLQHYNPVIDETVKKMFNVPASWKLIAQMPFGGIAADPQPKDKEDISQRVKVFR